MTKSTILYADDDIDDLFIVEQALASFADQIELVHVSDGVAAVNTAKRLCAQGNEPCLILLDINMPVMDGRQVLIQLRRHAATSKIPVALFTTSSSAIDKAFAAQWQARFFTKPVAFDELQQLARTFVSICAEEVSKP